MRKIMLSAGLLFAFAAGCGGKGGDADKFISEYEAIKTELCACTDKDCADKAKEKADAKEKWARENLPKPNDDQRKRFKELEGQVNDCAGKF